MKTLGVFFAFAYRLSYFFQLQKLAFTEKSKKGWNSKNIENEDPFTKHNDKIIFKIVYSLNIFNYEHWMI